TSVLRPDFGIYKTNSDYFLFLPAWVNDKGEVVGRPYYKSNDTRILLTETDTIYTNRVELIDSYYLSAEVQPNYPFTNITFKEFYRRQDSNNPIMLEEIQSRIINDDPFSEYYEVSPYEVLKYYDVFINDGYSPSEAKYKSFQKYALELNTIIQEGQLDQMFTKIK
ncbi:MAG: hypothetical protein R6U04_04945, partial [Bacteroidales bacterium]